MCWFKNNQRPPPTLNVFLNYGLILNKTKIKK